MHEYCAYLDSQTHSVLVFVCELRKLSSFTCVYTFQINVHVQPPVIIAGVRPMSAVPMSGGQQQQMPAGKNSCCVLCVCFEFVVLFD